MKDMLIPLALIGFGVFFLVTEAFIPSAGLLGVLSAICLVVGVLSSFYYGGMTVGTTFMTATFVGVGLLIAYMIKKWPETTFGKLILVEPPPEEELLPDRSELQSMEGRFGQAVSLMLPSGFVEIEGKRYDAVAQSTVEEGTWVKVQSIRNGRILVVRPVGAEEALQEQQAIDRERNPLSQPADEVLPDPFDDPLG